MDPLLLIVKYLFKKKNIINNDETIDSFFKNGVSFPLFIQTIFNVNSIPGIKKNPKLVFHQKINNDTALQYLFFKNEKIKLINPSYETEKNQTNLLQLILTLQCFPANIEEIIDKTNKILAKVNIHITKKSELLSIKILTSILNCLTNGSFPITQAYNDVINLFEKFKLPLVINEKCLDIQNSFIFIIQIQILFDHFSENNIKDLNIVQPKQEEQKVQQKQIEVNNNKPQIQNDNILQNSDNEIPDISSEPEVKTFSIKDRIKFYNMTYNNPNSFKFQPKKDQQPNLFKSSSQPDVQINKPSNELIVDQLKERSSTYANILDPKTESLQNEIVNGHELNSIVNNLFVDDEQNNEDIDQESEEISEDPEQLEKEFEEFQNFMSDFSIDEEEEKNEEESKNENLDSNFDNEKIINDDTEPKDDNKIEEEEEEEECDDDEIPHLQSFSKLSQNLSILNTGVSKFIKNLKNYINIESVYKQLKVDQSTSLEKLWNIPIENFNYDNGILYSEEKKKESQAKPKAKEVDKSKKEKEKLTKKSKSKESSDKESSINKEANIDNESGNKNNDINNDNNINKNQNNDNSNNDGNNNNDIIKQPKSNLYKIMRYDEQKYCWHFCESDLSKIVDNSEKNPIIPLVLLIDSKMDDINKISSVVRKDDLNNISENEISVLSFWNESTVFNDYIDYLGNIKKRENIDSIKGPLFLFVFIPKNKEKYKNIGTVLFQIYVFLILICDLSVLIIDQKYQAKQTLVMKEIVDLSKLIFENQKNDENEPKIFYDKSKLCILQYKENEKLLQQSDLESINIEFHIRNIQNAKGFLYYLEDNSFPKCYQYSDLVNTLNQVNSMFSQISSLYLYMRNESNNYSLMKEIIDKQLKIMNIGPKQIIDNSIIEKLKQDSYHFFIKNDKSVSKFLNMVMFDMSIKFNLLDNKNVKIKLNEQSQKNLESLKNEINKNLYWETNQITIIIQSHMNFLELQYFNILKNLGETTKLDVLYEQNLQILESQKKNDEDQLNNILNHFYLNIKKRKTVIKEKFDTSAKKGTNYVMKEVQSIREIEVICERGGDIDTIIEPDF